MQKELLEKFAEILEEDIILESDYLNSFDEWDSLTTLSLIAMADSDYSVTLSNDTVEEFETVNDVIEYILKNAK